jgi:hypothetical protein
MYRRSLFCAKQIRLHQLLRTHVLHARNEKGRHHPYPIQRKAEHAIALVARDKSYAYVFEKDNLHFYPPGDDILPLVRKRLGLPVASR